jgi:transposase
MSDLVARRQQLIQMRTQEKNRLQQTIQKAIIKDIEKHIKFMDSQIIAIDTNIDAKNDYHTQCHG